MSIEDIMPPDWQACNYTASSFDPAILATYAAVLKQFPTAYVNVLDGRRKHNWCGLRSPACAIGAPKSAHRMGKALDFHGRDASETRLIYDWCLGNGLRLGIARVEDWESTKPAGAGSTGWVHIDTMPPNEANWKDRARPYVFKP